MVEKSECCDDCHTSDDPYKCKLFGTDFCDTLNKYRSDKMDLIWGIEQMKRELSETHSPASNIMNICTEVSSQVKALIDIEEQRKYDEAHKEYFESIDEMEREKEVFLNKIKECVKPEHFQNILDEIEESENTGNYRITDEPKGEPQYNKEFDYTVWIYQIRMGEDWYNGTVCVKLPNGKYFIWDFEI